MKKLCFIALILISCTSVINAQGFFQFHAGPAFPSGDFVGENYDDAIHNGSGNAKTGLNLGVVYYSPLKTDGLSLLLSMNFFYNKLRKDYRNYLRSDLEKDFDVQDITYSKYINIPIMAGVNYKIPVKEKLAFYGEGSLGFNLLKITKYEYIGGDSDYFEKISPSLKLGFTIGGGVLVQDKYSIGLNYYVLGSHKCKYHSEQQRYNNDTVIREDKFEKSLDIREVTLTIGIKL